MTVFTAEQKKKCERDVQFHVYSTHFALKLSNWNHTPTKLWNGVLFPGISQIFFLNEKLSTISCIGSRKTAKAKLFMSASGTKPYPHSLRAIIKHTVQSHKRSVLWSLPHSFGNRSHKINYRDSFARILPT